MSASFQIARIKWQDPHCSFYGIPLDDRDLHNVIPHTIMCWNHINVWSSRPRSFHPVDSVEVSRNPFVVVTQLGLLSSVDTSRSSESDSNKSHSVEKVFLFTLQENSDFRNSSSFSEVTVTVRCLSWRSRCLSASILHISSFSCFISSLGRLWIRMYSGSSTN